jgi:hypothetical protein
MDRVAGLLLIASSGVAGYFHYRFRRAVGSAAFAAFAAFSVQLVLAICITLGIWWLMGGSFSGLDAEFVRERFGVSVLLALAAFWFWAVLKDA